MEFEEWWTAQEFGFAACDADTLARKVWDAAAAAEREARTQDQLAGEIPEQPFEGIACSDCGLTMAKSKALAELEALKADAERYRWLRSRVWANDPNIFSVPVLVGVRDANLLKGSVAQHFDAAIDSKMRSNAQIEGRD